MPHYTRLYNRLPERSILLLLFLASAAIYFIFFHEIILNINTMMSSITSDTLKNYYTYCYHIRHDPSSLHFQGLHYPYGEHIVFTDCQPLLTNILRLFPFVKGYEIGILHGFIFLSFIITPLLIYNVLRRASAAQIFSAVFALGVGLLSPQYLKMNAGHFGLCYTWMIPGAILLWQSIGQERMWRAAWWLALYNTLVFFIHPYMGLGLCVLSALLLLFSFRHRLLQLAGLTAVTAILPMLIFRLFLLATDYHTSRPSEVFGISFMIENLGSIITPTFGPFKEILGKIFPEPTRHYEGHSYVGLGSLLLAAAAIVMLFTPARRVLYNRQGLAILGAGFIMLFMSFGWHVKMLELFSVKSSALNQFRAASRFAWFFYYSLTIYLGLALAQVTEGKKWLRASLLATFVALCIIEAGAMFTLEPESFWRWKNIFNAEQLTAEESRYVDELKTGRYQAILPLPQNHVGSERYERLGENFVLIPAMIASCHSGVPICGMMASRTSVEETKNVLSVMNPYKKNNVAFELMDDRPFYVVNSKAPLMPDEDRIWAKTSRHFAGDSLLFGEISVEELRNDKLHDPYVIEPHARTVYDSTSNIIFVRTGDEMAFNPAENREYENIIDLKPDTLKPGKYVLSFHYHTDGDNLHAFSCMVIISGDRNGEHTWLKEFPIRFLSGFYNDVHVFEQYFDIEKGKNLKIFLYGHMETPYHISDLLIRPAGVDVMSGDRSVYNNFPRYAD